MHHTFYYLKKMQQSQYAFSRKEDFHKDGEVSYEEVQKCLDFAYNMTIGKYDIEIETKGEHRDIRSGGKKSRGLKQIYINTFQGKLAECAVHQFLLENSIESDEPDFKAYGKGEWDCFDLECYGQEISIKSTKSYGQLLLLEKADWDKNGRYIPNIGNGNERYDIFILVRINPNIDGYLKGIQGFENVNFKNQEQIHYLKRRLLSILSDIKWEYNITGYISNEDLKYIIENHYVIKQGCEIGTEHIPYQGTPMDADNYYVQAASMRKKRELIERLSEYKNMHLNQKV